MKDIPRIITGTILALGGFFLLFYILFMHGDPVTFGGLGAILLIIGVIILFNKHENKIEEIKKRK